MSNELQDFYSKLTDKQKKIIEEASQLAIEKQESENIPFPFGLFHPDVLNVLNVLRSTLGKEKGDGHAGT